MAKKEFLLQGFSPKTHGDAVLDLYNVGEVERVLFSIAFVTESGVAHIRSKLSGESKKTSVFAGVRNGITSAQGLKELYSILGHNLIIVDTGSKSILFHPKIYLVRGKQRARMIVGSSNLTLGGLNNNIEAGLILEFDLNDPEDMKLVKSVESQLDAMLTIHPDNVKRLTAHLEIDQMLANGIVVDESLRPPVPRIVSVTPGAPDDVPRMKLSTPPKRRKPRPASAPAPATHSSAGASVTSPRGVTYELVWESTPLKRRDLNIPSGSKTKPSGSINLDKGRLGKHVDQRHYFRENVFAALTWTLTSKATVEEAHADFELVVKGISYGVFTLRIGHSTDTSSATYKEGNAMTRLSWGKAMPFVKKTDLIGRTVSLYRDKADPKQFLIEID